jgi:FAD/FMN-containing dehydrogenase
MVGGATWTNWVGNQTCHPAAVLRPRDEGEVVAAVRDAITAGRNVRVAATGHSFTPVCLTDGVMLELADLAGVLDADPERRRATALAGTSVGAFGEPLWDVGLALANQGDIDTQQIGGAIGTGTHGSGIRHGSLSSTLRRARIVTGTGEVIEVSESTPELLHAAQVSVGMLGVMTEVEVEVAAAYRIRESILHLPYAEVAERWDELVRAHRHFSFFWIPVDGSGALYGLETPQGVPDGDTCYVKIYDEASSEEPDDATPLARVDRSYRIYPTEFEPNFHELEYFVPIDRGPEAVAAMRGLMLASQPDARFPMEVRTVAADDAYLSSQYGTATTVISVSGVPGMDYWDYLRDVDRLLGGFGARAHWGKLHFLTREQLLARYPAAEAFIRIRRELDPVGIFLNDHLRPLFA